MGAAKLPKLPITKFNGKIEAWLPFWGKFKSEIDSTDLPALTRFSYLKELLEESVRTDIDGLPFTEDGYTKAKGILESEYGQSAEVVHAYVQNIMSLPAINGTNPKKIHDFYKQLRYNVQSLETLGKLADVKGNVRSTLDKLKGIKADLVRGQEGWQEWTFHDLLKELKKWRDINPIEENSDRNLSKGHGEQSPRSKFFHAQDSHHETRVQACVYCEDNSHKSANCSEVVTTEHRKKILATKGLCLAFSSGRRAQNASSEWNLINIHFRHCDPTAWILKIIAYQCDCAII